MKQKETNNRNRGERLRVLRIAHSSLTPALRERERALSRCYEDIDLQVVTTEQWREAEVDVQALPDELFPVRTARRYLSKHIQLFAYDPRSIVTALREHRPHLIDMNHEPYSVACAELLTLRDWFAPQVPVVMQTAQNILHSYPAPFRWLEQRAFRKVAAAYVCSETVTEVLRTKGFKKEVATIPFGVNTEAFKPCDRRQRNLQDGPTIGFVGRMLPGKGLDVLAKSLAKLERLKWRLLVVGDGPERENFIHTLGHARLLDRVTFTGSMSYELVPQHFREMDIMVIPTQTTARIREQFGRVIVEAMASGVPVIGSTCGAIPEVISDAGLIFPEGDATALAAQLQKALGNADLREQLSRAGRARVEQHYTWEEVAHKTYQLFTAVLRRSNQSVGDPTLEFAAQADVF